MRIGINCGHTLSGAGYGATGFLNEVTEDRLVGSELINLLRKAGHNVINCTVDSAATQSAYLSKSVQIANGNNVDFFISIHFNAAGGKGTEVFTYKGEKLPEAVRTCEKISKLGFVNRGVKDGSNLYVINSTKARAMLIEVCFVDNKVDYELYKKVGYKKIAEAIFEAITNTNVNSVTVDKESKEMTKDEVAKMINETKDKVYNSVSEVPDWAKETVKKLMDKGALKGTDKGLELSQSILRILVINDRMGIYDK